MPLVAAGLLVLLAGCAPPAAVDADVHRSTGLLTVGFVDSLSGPLAGAGQDLLEGTQLWLEEHGGQMAGRPVELLVEDDHGSTETGVQVTKRLVEADGADLVIGPLAGNVGVALGRYVTTTEVPLVYPIPTSDVFVHENYPTVFQLTGTAPQFTPRSATGPRRTGTAGWSRSARTTRSASRSAAASRVGTSQQAGSWSSSCGHPWAARTSPRSSRNCSAPRPTRCSSG
ncbi:hypothetical protein BJF90_07465 [Pseudonocardia sp. CNS-004]|nr:hypothetical protein BJF90_07465 [Pseudonocardia sp. CNS-004]